jgi:uncharacterized protein (DUF362 family)
MMNPELVTIYPGVSYQDIADIDFSGLFDVIEPGNIVTVKPNWVKESHAYRKDEWEQVITHPSLLTRIIREVVLKLNTHGTIRVIDGPHFDASYSAIIAHYPVEQWKTFVEGTQIILEITDLRDEEFTMQDEIVIKKKALPGDPRGSVLFNLKDDESCFFNHNKSARGYYGAYYDITETNRAHDGKNNLYKLSRSVIESDVFINVPKLKTHKKAGITCCLKNLVGINTYRNYLPHHSEGGPAQGGDQFPSENINARLEGPVVAYVKQKFLAADSHLTLFRYLKIISRFFLGDTNKVVRSGNWHGNDTMWRTIIDLNKLLLYGNASGELPSGQFPASKKYIGIVDGIIAGEGNGPMAPDSVNLHTLIAGTNPVAIDAVCACLMGFDPSKIPSIKNAFCIEKFPIAPFSFQDIRIGTGEKQFQLSELPQKYIHQFVPHFGWKNFIEANNK